MREVKKCEWCGEEFVTYQKGVTCSQDCYIKNRKKKGWCRSPEMIKFSRGSVSRTKNNNHKSSSRNVLEM